MAEKPGVMLYFSVRPALNLLSVEDKGRLFEAILDYGEYGALPSFENFPSLAMAWEFLRPMLEKDSANYEDKVRKSRYAAYCKEADKGGGKRLSFSEWEEQIDSKRERTVTDGNARCRTIPNSNTNTNTNTNTNSNSNSNISSNSSVKGECERGNRFAPYSPMSEDDFEKNRQRGITAATTYKLREPP
jgi:hypothetical protein